MGSHKHSPTIGARVNRVAVRSVDCPKCGAKAGDNCTGYRGQIRWASHQERWDAFRLKPKE